MAGAPTGITTEGDLDNAIGAANNAAADSGTYVINLGADISLATALQQIDLAAGVTLDIEGNGFAIDGQDGQRGLYV